MHEYVNNLRQRFNNSEHLARFMGVSVNAVWAWTSGSRKPTGTNLRMLQVLGVLVLEAPHVFDALIGKEAPPKCNPIVLPPLRPVQRLVPSAPRAVAAPAHGRWYVSDEAITERAGVLSKAEPPELLPEAPADDVGVLLGKSRFQWLTEYEDDGSAAILALSDDDYDRVKAFIGK